MVNNVRKSTIMVKTKPSNPEAKTHNYNDLNMKTSVKANLEPKCCRVTIRDIAKMFTYSLGVKLKSDEFLENVEANMRMIENLPIESRNALKMAYLFSSRVPENDKQDFYQDIALILLKKRIQDEKLAYTIARCDWVDWWRNYKHKQDNEISLDKLISFDNQDNESGSENRSNGIQLSDLLVGAIEYENAYNPKAKRIINSIKALPHGKQVIEIASKRLQGIALSDCERKVLSRFVQSNPIYYLTN